MTCIVGIEGKEDGHYVVVIGSDSLVVTDVMKTASAPKIIDLYHDRSFLIGVCGPTRVTNIIANALDYEDPDEPDRERELVAKFVPALRKCLREQGALRKTDTGEEFMDNELLIAIRGQLYYIGCYFSVAKADRGYRAIGSGGQFATGALAATADTDRANSYRHRVNHALEIAADFCTTVGGPFECITSKAFPD